MNKTAIKNYAIWARVQLIESAKQRAYEYEITENGENNPNMDTIGGRLLSKVEKEQRQQLIAQIRQKGYTQVIEEAAYTWFNRFIALRFMEVNGYLPSKVRVFTDESGAFKPEILKEAMTIELEGLDRGLVLELLDKQDNEALYKHLLIAQCNALNTPLPYMFERISNWTELLFPVNLLRPDSVIGTMISSIPEEDWMDAVQIIGWLYQYYNSELKDETFTLLSKNVKITKERIPAATQLFTPDWIVRYMVENSLGRLWYEGHKDFDKSSWKYYLNEAEQELEVEHQLTATRADLAKIKPEEIKVIDPCMGSGHILVYAFDILMQIYTAAGWSERDAVKSILLNNLYGLDIDDRAGQLAYFAVMMKAQQYDSRWLSRQSRNPILLNVFALQNSNDRITVETLLKRVFPNHTSIFGERAFQTAKLLFTVFEDAKDFGSIIQLNIELSDLISLRDGLIALQKKIDLFDLVQRADAISLIESLMPLVCQAIVLSQKYSVVVTNPPYMGNANMNEKLSVFVRANYPDSRGDMFAVFIEKGLQMLASHGLEAMVTMQSWMFLSTYTKLRTKLIQKQIINMMHLGANAFDSSLVQASAFIVSNNPIDCYRSTFVRLTEQKTAEDKEQALCNSLYRYVIDQREFGQIDGSPVAYWLSKSMFHAFIKGKKLGTFAYAGQGMATTNNARFLRFWHEVDVNKIGFDAKSEEDTEGYQKWFLYNKGGEFRKWYGDNDLVVNFQNHAKELSDYISKTTSVSRRIANRDWFFKECFSWSLIGNTAAFRYKSPGYIFDVAGMSCFASSHLYYLLALCNSVVAMKLLLVLAPTVNFQCGDIANIPVFFDDSKETIIEKLTLENISVSQDDWDTFETSWDFQRHPLVIDRHEYEDQMLLNFNAQTRQKSVSLISKRFEMWQQACEDRFAQLKANEEELNRIFIDIYGLQDELKPDVDDKDVTVRKADLNRDICSLISYAIGCIMGRYSLDKPGLAFAGGAWDVSQYKTYMPDKDGILPITDDEYFGDDIVGMFVNWVRTVYGADTLEENLRFIANALGGKGTPREVIRNYFLNDFYADHLKIYQKRPIYWLFSSGKKNGFKCLIYMHRYQPDLLARIRTDYVHEQQERYRTQLTMLEDSLQTAGASEHVKLNKQITKIKDQALELQQYEEKIHHLADQMISIDLDDGVKVNYAKFQDVLEKIK